MSTSLLSRPLLIKKKKKQRERERRRSGPPGTHLEVDSITRNKGKHTLVPATGATRDRSFTAVTTRHRHATVFCDKVG